MEIYNLTIVWSREREQSLYQDGAGHTRSLAIDSGAVTRSMRRGLQMGHHVFGT